jgi:hypothetical protein
MSLIIAIEPDREQANQLKELVRQHTKAELILADTTARAIGAIEQRVPDLVLIPAFLSPQDDEALTAALRVTEEAAHVQTLTIPVLGAPDARATQSSGVFSRLLREQPRAASPDGCDPKVFADQITEYLERVAQERGPSKVNDVAKPGRNGDGRKHHAAAPAPAAAPRPTPVPPTAAVDEKRAPVIHAPAAAAATAAPENNAVGGNDAMPDEVARALESALATDDGGGLEEGLSTLMERLSAEDWSEPADADAPELDLMTALDEVKAPAPPVAVTQHWPEKLREIESAEYKMPTTVPRDSDTAANVTRPVSAPSVPAIVEEAAAAASTQEPAAAPPATQTAPATKGGSEWGDLLESLNKELGK